MIKNKTILLAALLIIIAAIRIIFPHPYTFTKKKILYPQIGGYCDPNEKILSKLEKTEIKPEQMYILRFLKSEFFLSAPYYAVSVYDPVSGFSFHWNESIPFHAASTYKAALLGVTYYLAQKNPAALRKNLYVHNSFVSIADKSVYQIPGVDQSVGRVSKYLFKRKKVSYLLNEMSVYSDNLATNLIIDYFGTRAYQKTLSDWNINGIAIKRGVYDITSHRNCIDNQVTSRSLVRFYYLLNKGRYFNYATKVKLLRILKSTWHKDRLPARLPRGVKVAHKPGRIDSVSHDAGIVYPVRGSPYYIAILTGFYTDINEVNESIARVSRFFYTEIMKKRKGR